MHGRARNKWIERTDEGIVGRDDLLSMDLVVTCAGKVVQLFNRGVFIENAFTESLVINEGNETRCVFIGSIKDLLLGLTTIAQQIGIEQGGIERTDQNNHDEKQPEPSCKPIAPL